MFGGRIKLQIALLIVVTLVASQAFAQTTATDMQALRKEVEALKAGQKDMQKTLSLIKDMMMGKQPPLEDVYINIEGAMTQGDTKAKVVMVEFSDYQCPFCGRHATDTYPQLMDQYVKTGKMRYILKNFPLEQIHPYAEKAAEAAECMGEQGKYWEAHDRLFKNQQALDVKELPAHALVLGLDVPKFQQCLDGGKYTAKVKADVAEGTKLNVRGTPSFFFGVPDPKDPKRMKAVKFLSGALPMDQFKEEIDKLLNPPKEEGGAN
jgi:protein-disulfide isomerase